MGIIANATGQQASTPANIGQMNNKQLVRASAGRIATLLPKTMDKERFISLVIGQCSKNPKLMDCTQQSFMGAVLSAAQCGLEIGDVLGHAYLVPFYNGRSKCMEASLQVGYKGMIQLARRSGQISIIKACTVYEGDEFQIQLGTAQQIHHVPCTDMKARGEVVGYYAFYRLKDGYVDFDYMSKDEILEHAKSYSSTYKDGRFIYGTPWANNFDEMAKKTVLKKVLKYAPMATEAFIAIDRDERISTVDIDVFGSDNDEPVELDINTSYGIPGSFEQEEHEESTGLKNACWQNGSESI